MSRGVNLKGRTCSCGFATVADKAACPRCGRATLETEWEDRGRVLSYCALDAAPEGHAAPVGLAIVEVLDKGPKVACWSRDALAAGDEVDIRKGTETTYTCSRRAGT